MSLGFKLAGFDLVAAYDNWDKVVPIYKKNIDNNIFSLDLSKPQKAVEHIFPYSPDGIIGGPPCQDFSSAGNRKEGKNAYLLLSFAEIICKIKPRFFVLENVARTRNSLSYAKAQKKFLSSGYKITEIILDASFCNVPQIRKRWFSIGKLDNLLLQSFHESIKDKQTKKSLTVFNYMKKEITTQFYYRHPRNYSRRAIYSIHEPSATIRGVNRPIPPRYPGHRLDAAPIKDARPLTTAERSRIQTFPNWWSWDAQKTHTEQMIGNAVPVNLAYFLAESMQETLF